MILRQRNALKRIALIMSISLAVLSLAGCGTKSSTMDATNNPSMNGLNSPEASKESSPSSINNDLEQTGLYPPAGTGITKFLELKGKAYEQMKPLNDKIANGEDAMASLALLPLMSSDLSILPLAMIITLPSKGDNVWEGEFRVMTDGKGRAELKGEICTFDMELAASDGSQEKMIITGEYDTKKDSLKASFTTGDKETVLFEYAASGDGYVSQLFYTGDDGKPSLIRNAFDEKNLYAGMTSENAKPDNIYQQNIELGESFIQSDKIRVVMNNGKGYALIDGIKHEY